MSKRITVFASRNPTIRISCDRERDDTTYTFVVDDIAQAVEAAKSAAGEKNVALLGGSISRQCLKLGLVDEIVLDVVPLLLGDGIYCSAAWASE